MPLRSDHKALLFLGAVALLGAGVRMSRATGKDAAPSAQPALDRQASAADSASRAARGRAGGGKGKSGRGSLGRDSASRPLSDVMRRTPVARGLLDRPGYIGAKLDLDAATAAQIDSLPGITPSLAKRIVADRMERGPFLNRDGLRRVIGIAPAILARIDSLVTFTGTMARSSPSDSTVSRAKKSARRLARQPLSS